VYQILASRYIRNKTRGLKVEGGVEKEYHLVRVKYLSMNKLSSSNEFTSISFLSSLIHDTAHL
jgi:hypothetical protein